MLDFRNENGSRRPSYYRRKVENESSSKSEKNQATKTENKDEVQNQRAEKKSSQTKIKPHDIISTSAVASVVPIVSSKAETIQQKIVVPAAPEENKVPTAKSSHRSKSNVPRRSSKVVVVPLTEVSSSKQEASLKKTQSQDSKIETKPSKHQEVAPVENTQKDVKVEPRSQEPKAVEEVNKQSLAISHDRTSRRITGFKRSKAETPAKKSLSIETLLKKTLETPKEDSVKVTSTKEPVKVEPALEIPKT